MLNVYWVLFQKQTVLLKLITLFRASIIYLVNIHAINCPTFWWGRADQRQSYIPMVFTELWTVCCSGCYSIYIQHLIQNGLVSNGDMSFLESILTMHFLHHHTLLFNMTVLLKMYTTLIHISQWFIRVQIIFARYWSFQSGRPRGEGYGSLWGGPHNVQWLQGLGHLSGSSLGRAAIDSCELLLDLICNVASTWGCLGCGNIATLFIFWIIFICHQTNYLSSIKIFLSLLCKVNFLCGGSYLVLGLFVRAYINCINTLYM